MIRANRIFILWYRCVIAAGALLLLAGWPITAEAKGPAQFNHSGFVKSPGEYTYTVKCDPGDVFDVEVTSSHPVEVSVFYKRLYDAQWAHNPRTSGETALSRTEELVLARVDSGPTKEDEFNNYQRISRLAADVRQEKIREILDYMDRNGIKYYRYSDFNQNYIHINLNGMLVGSNRVIGTSTSHSITVPVRFSSSLPSHELGAYIFGTIQGRAFLENRIFEIAGHVFSGLMARGEQQEGVATQYHIHTSLSTMGHPFTQLRPYQDSRVDILKTWVVPLRDSLGQVPQEQRNHVIRLIEQLQYRM